MLEKIVNISANSDYKNKASSGKQSSKSNVFRNVSSLLSDSISFSPAVAFMTAHHWKLNVIEKENEKTIIDFELDGIRFQIKVNENDLIKSQDIDYNVMKNFETAKNKVSVSAQFKSFVSADALHRVELKSTLPYLNNFLSELSELSGYVYQLSENHYVIQNALEKDYEALKSEFTYLNSSIINFLEMYLSRKFVFSLIEKNQGKHLSLSKLNISKI